MKPLSLIAILCLCLAVMTQAATPEADAPAAPLSLALITSGPVPTNLVDRVRRHVEFNLRLAVSVRALEQPVSEALLRNLTSLPGLKKTNELSVVILAAGVATGQSHGFLNPTNQVVAINVDGMKADDMETFARRLEKQVMRGYIHVAGITSCPNPLCCLYAYQSTEELDGMGRNTCPPCLGQWEDLLATRKIPLLERVYPEGLKRKLNGAQSTPAPAPGQAKPAAP
jgi:hypothetical protein